MRKIDLTEYDAEVLTEEGTKTLPYSVKETLDIVLYHPDLKLGYRELFENDRVAQKIRASNGSVLLEESEYIRLKSALETIHGFMKKDLEMVRRVMDAPEVAVTTT